MSKQKPPCCGNCKFGEFHLQKNGQINRSHAGRCLFIPAMPPLPISITKAYGFQGEFYKTAIWPNSEGCPTHEPRKDVK